MIQNAKDTKLCNTVVLPGVSTAVMSMLQTVNMAIMQKQQINGYTQEIPDWKRTLACVQPMKESLAIRKEGERSWRWHVIWTLPTIDLKTDDRIILMGIRYRIMDRTNWTQHGYVEYSAIEDYRPGDAT